MELPPVGAGLPLGQKIEAARSQSAAAKDAATREAARAYEATFLAEMLKSAGLNRMPESFGGGEGEEAFSSFLTQEYAKKLSEHGGIGLAEQIFETLKRKE